MNLQYFKDLLTLPLSEIFVGFSFISSGHWMLITYS